MSDVIYAIILGIIQGLTEFLPVSSSGHLVVVSWFMDGKPLPLALNIALHLGTVLAVLMYFWREWWMIAVGLFDRVTKNKPSFASDRLLPSLVIGSIPAAVIGLSWKDEIEQTLHNPAWVIGPLVIVGILMVVVDKRSKSVKEMKAMTFKQAFIIGIAQSLALVPGVSRSGATITAGRALGYDRSAAARYSFLLGTPAMLGAALLYGKDIINHFHEPIFFVGFISSFISGALAIKFFLGFIKKFGFMAFAIYRTMLAATIFISLL